MEKFRYELASFNFGRQSANVPIATKTSGMDGMTQLYVPEGKFFMGEGDRRLHAYSPQHAVYLDAFWIDKVEATNAMYEKCVNAGGCNLPASDNLYYGKWAYRNLPVVYVNWFGAEKYCQWAGRRLPTEAEWEKAARGVDRRFYPWGNERPNPRLANFNESLIGEALPADRYPLGASPYGALNMTGNVREWVADWYDKDYYSVSPYKNPTGPKTGTERSLRSGSYDARWNDIETFQRFKHEPDSAGLSRGFRCAESGK